MSGSDQVEDKFEGSTGDASMALTPFKNYITVIGDKKDRKWICNFGCRHDPYTGTYSRIRAHFLGKQKSEKSVGVVRCSKISPSEIKKLKEEEEATRDSFGGALRKRKNGPMPTQHGKRSIFNNPIDNVYKLSQRGDAVTKIARFFYGCGILFNVGSYKRSSVGLCSFKLRKIRTSLLDKEKTSVDSRLVVIKENWADLGVSIISDGWSNVRNQPLINVLAVCGGKPVFIDAIDSSGQDKTATYIADLILKVIESVGKYNVIQILTDNAANCKAAGDIIMNKMPHIFWSGCMPHTLNLLMMDIAQSDHLSLAFIGVCYRKVKEMVNYIRTHSFVNHIFKKFSELGVMQVKNTRFGSHYVVMERLYKLRTQLVSMVLSDDWKLIRKGTSRSKLAHDEVKNVIMDGNFWDDLKFVLSFTKKIYGMIRFCDSDKAVIGEVYQKMEDTLGSIREILTGHVEMSLEIEKLVMTRWKKMNMPLHSLAYVLNPYYYSESWLKSLGPGNKNRVKPHADPFVQSVYLDVIRKLTSSPEEFAIVRRQFGDFTSNTGVFAKPTAKEDKIIFGSIEWWHLYGVAAPQLYALAIKVLSQTVNSSCAERVWSSFSFIHDVSRNLLLCDRAKALIFIHYNLQILSRYEEDYKKTYKNWDYNTHEELLQEDVQVIEDAEYNILEQATELQV